MNILFIERYQNTVSSLEESVDIAPIIIFVLLFLGSGHLSGLRLYVSHAAHVTAGIHIRSRAIAAIVATGRPAIVVSIGVGPSVALSASSAAHHDPLGLLLTVEDHEFFGEVLVLHAQLLPNLHQSTETVYVIRVLLVDIFVDLEGLVEEVHASVAGGDHELPLDFAGLYLEGTLEVDDGLFELVLLRVVHPQARDHVDLRRVVPVRLLVVVHRLELVLLLLIQIAHLCQYLRIAWHLSDQDVVPLEGLATHADQLVDMGYLVDHLVTVRNDCVQLLEGLKTLVVVAETLVH